MIIVTSKGVESDMQFRDDYQGIYLHFYQFLKKKEVPTLVVIDYTGTVSALLEVGGKILRKE
jgi:hypothetical protein